MSDQKVLYEREGEIATCTLNRPDKLNAVSFPLLADLESALTQAEADGVRAIIIQGAGRAFCAGDDLAGMGRPVKGQHPATAHHVVINAIRTIRVPVIARIHGFAIGAGFDLSLACDFRVMADDAEIGCFRVNRSMNSNSGAAYWLPKMIGLSRATEILLLGERLSAAKAADLGIVHRVAPPDKLDDEITKLTDRLLELPTQALGAHKTCINYGIENDLLPSLVKETTELVSLFKTDDYKEAISAFLGKRPAKFTGK